MIIQNDKSRMMKLHMHSCWKTVCTLYQVEITLIEYIF